MKKFFVLLALFAAACSKQKPDWDQADCRRVDFYKQRFTDSTRSVKIGEAILEWPQNGGDNLLCGAELAKDLKSVPIGWSLCDADGTKYFEFHYAIIE